MYIHRCVVLVMAKFNYEDLANEKSSSRKLSLVQLVLHYFHKINFSCKFPPARRSSVQGFEPQNIINIITSRRMK
jgi:hypothetical protein